MSKYINHVIKNIHEVLNRHVVSSLKFSPNFVIEVQMGSN
jgi:hypothetical protein